jgi:hypothetical protein
MEYLLTCQCGAQHVVSNAQAGESISCSCGEQLEIPTLRGLKQLPVHAPVDPETGEDDSSAPGTSQSPQTIRGGSKSRAAWQGWRGPTMAILTAVMVVSAMFAAFYFWQRFLIDTSYTIEKLIEADRQLLAQADPIDLDQAWKDFAGYNLRQKRPPHFFVWNRYAEHRVYQGTVASVIAAVSGLLAAAVWISARRVRDK